MMYYLRLSDDGVIDDIDGTEFISLAAARAHAIQVARELTFKSKGIGDAPWSHWTLSAHDGGDTQLFVFPMRDFEDEE